VREAAVPADVVSEVTVVVADVMPVVVVMVAVVAVEMAVVMAVMAVTVAVAMPRLTDSRERQAQHHRRHTLDPQAHD
jgi:hypothetical protein